MGEEGAFSPEDCEGGERLGSSEGGNLEGGEATEEGYH